MTSHLVYEVTDEIATITLNRPDRMNAFTLDMIDDWANALWQAHDDANVRAVVVTGTGQAFCAGVDFTALDEIEETPLARKRVLTDRIHQVVRATRVLEKPLVAAINGAAVGAGLDMALMCDLRFAGRSARMSEGYIRIGVVPGDGGAWFLPRLVGAAKALELLFTGDFVDAAEALRIGMVNRVYDDNELAEGTRAFCRGLCEMSPLPLAMIKRAVRQSERLDLDTSLDLISSHMAIVQSSEDYVEARAAFRERRPGRFSSR